MSTEFVINADDGYEEADLPSVTVRIAGKEYTAYCPKDSLPITLSRLQEQLLETGDVSLHEKAFRQLLSAVFDKDDTEELLDRLLDLGEHKVTIAYLTHTIGLIQQHYAPLLEQHYEEMGVATPGIKQPTDRQPRKTARRTPTRTGGRKALTQG